MAGRPFIEHLLDKAVREGFAELILLAGYRHEAVEAYAGAWRGVPLRLSIEPEPLDTAGAVARAAPMLRDDFLLVNGDTWFDFDWSSLRLSDGLHGLVAAREVSPADRLRNPSTSATVASSPSSRAPIWRQASSMAASIA